MPKTFDELMSTLEAHRAQMATVGVELDRVEKSHALCVRGMIPVDERAEWIAKSLAMVGNDRGWNALHHTEFALRVESGQAIRPEILQEIATAPVATSTTR